MALETELGYVTPLSQPHAAILNVYYTAAALRKFATEFFQQFGLTDVQFNLLMLLKYQSQDQPGLSQTRLSEMMMVNRANITALIDRMERADLVERTAVPDDRRSYQVVLTDKAAKLLEEVEPVYIQTVQDAIAPLSEKEQAQLVQFMEKVRDRISHLQAKQPSSRQEAPCHS